MEPHSIDAASFAFSVLEKSPDMDTSDLIAMIIRKAYDLKKRLEADGQ